MNNNLIPSIRFKGFNDVWEQRKLGDTVQITMGQSPDGSTYSDVPSDYILVQGNADLQNGWVFPRVWTSQMTKKADVGDLIMSVRAPAGAMGKTAYNAVIGRGVAAIKGNEFIYQLLVKMDSDGYWKALSCGSTFESLNSDNIKNADVLIPDVAEQKKIGEYFANLDHLITLHQRKYDKLVNIKKSMLEKMFPKNGLSVPEIRFKGFNDAWEQRKLGELCSLITKGTTPKDKSGNGEVNFVKVENIDTDNGEITSMSKISVEEHEGYLRRSRLEENDILFSIAGTLGRVSVVKPSILPANTNQALAIIRTNRGYIPYLTAVLKGPAVEDFIRKNPTIGAQPNLSLEQVNNLDISYPEYDEQVKIGDYFESLDNLITLHQRKLEKLQNIKKSMLEKMFPSNK